MSPLFRKCFAEFLGSAFLIATVIGSGIMATNLTDNIALQLLSASAGEQRQRKHVTLVFRLLAEHHVHTQAIYLARIGGSTETRTILGN
jgi:glycerol uptake facilitator-like aquaporin